MLQRRQLSLRDEKKDKVDYLSFSIRNLHRAGARTKVALCLAANSRYAFVFGQEEGTQI